jgi:hypothetical protein
MGLQQHLMMPARESKDCPHRARFGKNIASLRVQRKLTYECLIERAGTSTRNVQSLEVGEYFPSLLLLVRLKSSLRCNWEELFGGCDKA